MEQTLTATWIRLSDLLEQTEAGHVVWPIYSMRKEKPQIQPMFSFFFSYFLFFLYSFLFFIVFLY